MTQINYEELAMQLLKGQTAQKAVSGPTVPPNAIYGHGAGGLFNTPCVDRALFSAMTLPSKGLAALLPVMPSVNDDPRVGIITGVTATDDDPETNDAISGECGRGPSAGKLKYCVINDYPFGDQSRSIDSINIRKTGRMACRTDTMDYGILGDPFNAGADINSVPGFPGMSQISGVANNEAAKALFQAGVAWARDFARDLYTGNPAAAYHEWSKPFRGLDLLINTGYSDLVSGNLCTRVDSYVATAASWGITNVETNPNETTQAVVEIANLLYGRASKMGLDPARFALAMHPNLFRKLAYSWPCSFYTGGCTPSTGYTGSLDAYRQQAMTQDMLKNSYLLVGGGKIQVVQDEAIAETGSGELSSDIYFINTHVLNNTVTTYLEHFDYNAPNGAMAIANQLGHGANYQTYDGGRFLAHFIAPEGTCIQTAFYAEPRLRVDTPWLSGRLTGVSYTPLLPIESSFPGDATYLNGGNFGPNPGADDTCAKITECEDNEDGVLNFELDSLIACADEPFNTNVLITINSGADAGTTIPGVITDGDGTTTITVTFSGAFATLTCGDVDTFVGADICCAFGDTPPQ